MPVDSEWGARHKPTSRMIILVLNPGSASLKFDVIDALPHQARADEAHVLARGAIEPIGGHSPKLTLGAAGHPQANEAISAHDYEEATQSALSFIDQAGNGVPPLRQIELVAFRVVHGGVRFAEPARIDDGVVQAIHDLSELAPLHNKPALSVVAAAGRALPDTPKVAVFDTSFHSTLPEHAWRYAIPPELAERHGIRRYGFHGSSHRCMIQRYADLVGKVPSDVKIVTLHLESGCSATAVDGGRSVDTSMGFTPLEGLMMGARSGDLDPAIVGYLCEKEHLSLAEVGELLNKKCGLLGVSGTSLDTRDLMRAFDADPRARLAMELFCYRIRKYVGAYLAALNGAEAIVFGGGIGEDTPYVRERVCAGFGFCGLELDAKTNESTINAAARISTPSSALHAYVVPTDEGLQIAHEAAQCLLQSEGPTVTVP